MFNNRLLSLDLGPRPPNLGLFQTGAESEPFSTKFNNKLLSLGLGPQTSPNLGMTQTEPESEPCGAKFNNRLLSLDLDLGPRTPNPGLAQMGPESEPCTTMFNNRLLSMDPRPSWVGSLGKLVDIPVEFCVHLLQPDVLVRILI